MQPRCSSCGAATAQVPELRMGGDKCHHLLRHGWCWPWAVWVASLGQLCPEMLFWEHFMLQQSCKHCPVFVP